ncbi:amidase [Amphritea sp.]|uniref:amidase n=1 Tax=Amphritea sp. TaxID=1872502 RepID=UPI003A8F96FF
MDSQGIEICFSSASELLRNYQSQELSPLDVIDVMIERSDSIKETVNPFADMFFDQAREEAKKSERRYSLGTAKALDGIPLLIKDNVPIKGIRATSGSYLFAEKIADATDPTVGRLLDAGANFFARSTCPEFCWLYSCHSKMWGVTRNPWRLDASPGGSSGGSAAALAAGATTLAIGTDSTGSIRHPASQCGVIGYKPPFGRNPAHYSESFHNYNSVGPMARTIADVVLMQNIMSGPYALDPNSLPQLKNIDLPSGNLRGLKVAFSMDQGFYQVHENVIREMLNVIGALTEAGAIVEMIDVNWAKEATQLAHESEVFLVRCLFEDVYKNHLEITSQYMPELIESARSVTPARYRLAQSIAGELWFKHVGPLFVEYDAFLTPTVSNPEIPAENGPFSQLDMNGIKLTDTETSMTSLFNMFNQCPVLCVPAGMSDMGLPIGVQIIGRPYTDETVFEIGAAIEQRLPLSRKPEL